MPALLLLWGGRSGGRLIIIVLENTPFLRDCCLSPAPSLPTDWRLFEYFWLRLCIPQLSLCHPRGKFASPGRRRRLTRSFFRFLCMNLRPSFYCAPLQEQKTQSSPILSLCSDPKQWRKRKRKKNTRWKEEGKTLIKTSSAGICCVTAVYIFTQACIIMVCLVCRSSQKLFRSPGVWKAFKHFIRISPLW